MDIRELATTFLEAFEAGDFDTAASYMSDDFAFSGATPEPISGGEWLGLAAAMKAAFPDITYNFRVESVEGNVVTTSNQLSGTHTGDFDLSGMGMGVIPATGNSFQLPAESTTATVEGDLMTSVHVNATPEGGVAGILAQIGVEMPSN
jgi:hypothetical protein